MDLIEILHSFRESFRDCAFLKKSLFDASEFQKLGWWWGFGMVESEDGPKATFCCSKTTVVVVVLVAVLCLFIGYNICIQYISTVH